MPDFSCDFYRCIFAKEREFYVADEACVSVMFLHNGSDLAEKLHGESNGVGGICKSKEMIVGIVCHVEVLKLNRGDCLTDNYQIIWQASITMVRTIFKRS